MKTKLLLLAPAILLAVNIPMAAQIASGGPYVLQKSVIAGGGGAAAAGPYSVEKTTGQAVAGTTSTGGVYTVAGGFWAPLPLSPTSANASVSGRVVRKGSGGISQAVIVLGGGPFTSPRSVVTSSFGYFRIEDVPVGYFYVLTVAHKKYVFAQNTYSFSLFDEITDIEFLAEN